MAQAYTSIAADDFAAFVGYSVEEAVKGKLEFTQPLHRKCFIITVTISKEFKSQGFLSNTSSCRQAVFPLECDAAHCHYLIVYTFISLLSEPTDMRIFVLRLCVCPKVWWARAGRQTLLPGWWCPKSQVGGSIALLNCTHHPLSCAQMVFSLFLSLRPSSYCPPRPPRFY